MPITWRVAAVRDIEPCLAIQKENWGEALVGRKSAVAIWRNLIESPFTVSAVYESSPSIRGHRLIGFAAAVFTSSKFAKAEIENPRPDILSRLFSQIERGRPALATRNDVAQANAGGGGVDVLVLACMWVEEILSLTEKQDMLTLIPASFAEVLAGYRICTILYETVTAHEREFAQRSIVYRTIAQFPELNRAIHVMDRHTVQAVSGSLGNVIFNYREPVLRLRKSDQQMLVAALRGATDSDLADELGATTSAVKARWRSVFSRIAETKRELVGGPNDGETRGPQKRHIVLAYLRTHPEELRPYV